MELTVRKVLERLKEIDCKLIAGENGLENEITVVDDMEIPDIVPWLLQGELLVTTGYSIMDKKNGLFELVKNIKNAKAAGIVLKTRFLGEIPSDVIAEANFLEIPLILTPNELSFGEVKKIIYLLLIEVKSQQYSYKDKIQTEFMKIELSDGGFQKLLEKANELIGLPMAIIDYTDILIAKCVDKATDQNFFLEDFINDSNYNIFKYSNEENTYFYYGSKRFLIFKIFVQQIVCSYVVVCCENKKIDDNAQIVLDYLRNAIALEYNKIQAIKRSSRVLDDNLFVDIIMENIGNKQAARYRAQSLNWPCLPILMILFDIDNFENYTKTKGELEILHGKNRITQIISNCAVRQNMSNTVFSKGDYFFLISTENEKKAITQSVEEIFKVVKEDLKMSLTAACVRNIAEYTDIKTAYKEAEDAIEICRAKFKNQKFLFTEDVLLELGLMHNMNPYILKYLSNTMGKLEKFDKENNCNLTIVLIKLIENMGVRTKTAEALFMHRNTLTYKLAKIEDILSVDLSESAELFKLGTANFIKQLL